MDRYITGLWTQRSPLRDADTPYLYTKFYSATRFDSLIDGLNREVTAKLTMARRPGHTVYNANTFDPIRTMYSYKYMLNNVQQVRTMVDTDTQVLDGTPPNKKVVMTKSAGAGRTRFLSIGTQLFMANGVDQKKWTQASKTWQPSTQFNDGDFIIDSNGNIQYIVPSAQATATITNVAVVQVQTNIPVHPGDPIFYKYFLVLTFSAAAPRWALNTSITFTGLTGYTALNGQTYVNTTHINVPGQPVPTVNQSVFPWTGPSYASAADTGTATGGSSSSGISGGTAPAWNATVGGTTTDGSITWTNLGSATQNWQMTGPANAPVIANTANDRFWRPNTSFGLYFSCLDSNRNLEVITAQTASSTITGTKQPVWSTKQGGFTQDGGYTWVNCGNIGSWGALTAFTLYSAITDPNGNLQYVSAGSGNSGAAAPAAWNLTPGGTTTDGALTWTNAGSGAILAYGDVSYCYSYEGLDGSVSTASPLVTIPNGVLGPNGGYQITLQGITTPDPQCPLIDIFRRPQGGSTPLLLTKIPNPCIGSTCTWSFVDTLPDSALNEQQPAPIALTGNPPAAGATAPVLHLQRVWMIVGSKVIWSGGPDIVYGNGFTSFPPANVIDFQEQLTKLIPITTSQGAALLVIGSANTYAVLGQGTPTSPFYPAMYMATVGSLQYDAICMVGSTPYIFTNNSKFTSLDPSGGYVENGFPIGDQFTQLTTAGFNAQVFTPTNTYVSWYEKKSGDSAIFVADGAVGWFRYSPVASPEQGYLWSPFAGVVNGTSAVLSIETSTGQFDLLVGPPAGGGPILKRDTTTNADNGQLYDAYMTLGNIVLCESGEVAEVAHVALDSIRVGDRPTVGMLYNEIAATTTNDFDTLTWTSVDPPNLDESETMYSDRYSTLQDGVCPKCTHCQIKIDWGSQNYPDELLSHTLYGAKFGERRQAA